MTHLTIANLSIVLSCVVDIPTAIIPQTLLWRVQMKKSTKRSLNIIFSLGLITSSLSIARVATINNKVENEDSTCRSHSQYRFHYFSFFCLKILVFSNLPSPYACLRHLLLGRGRNGHHLRVRSRHPSIHHLRPAYRYRTTFKFPPISFRRLCKDEASYQ